ncbi:hypothetical protein AGMMS49944_09150 [Spirochaetia bacterium]|nr:hypothetical protein AGMMS49944_09150 [Spirochaetia bacterium]
MAEKKKTIDGVTFTVAPFRAIDGLRLKATLVRLFGPALGELLGGLNLGKIAKTESAASLDSLQDMSLDAAPIAHAVEKLMSNLDEDTMVALAKRLLMNVICNWNQDGKNRAIAFATDFDAAFEAIFSQKLFTLYPVIGFVLEVNYPDFFDKVVGGIGKRVKLTRTLTTDEETLNSAPETSEQSET